MRVVEKYGRRGAHESKVYCKRDAMYGQRWVISPKSAQWYLISCWYHSEFNYSSEIWSSRKYLQHPMRLQVVSR